MDRFILENGKPVECNDLMKWAKWLETADRHVAKTKRDNIEVSTVFLGLDHGFGNSSPILFETMVFGGTYDQEQRRYSTVKEAKAGHKEMCKLAFRPKRQIK